MTAFEPEGYLAKPISGIGKPVMIFHPWWGLNDTIRSFCDRLAGEGYLVFAPDLYHGKIATTIPEAEQLGKELEGRYKEAKKESIAAAHYLLEKAGDNSKALGAIGFSLGAGFALNLAAAMPEIVKAVVLFYGAGEAEFARSQAAYLGHFAENDEYEPKKWVDWMEEELRKAGREVTFHTYPSTGHWFCEPDRVNEYDEPAAELAWSRTFEFLKQKLTGSSS